MGYILNETNQMIFVEKKCMNGKLNDTWVRGEINLEATNLTVCAGV